MLPVEMAKVPFNSLAEVSGRRQRNRRAGRQCEAIGKRSGCGSVVAATFARKFRSGARTCSRGGGSQNQFTVAVGVGRQCRAHVRAINADRVTRAAAAPTTVITSFWLPLESVSYDAVPTTVPVVSVSVVTRKLSEVWLPPESLLRWFEEMATTEDECDLAKSALWAIDCNVEPAAAEPHNN